MSYIIDKDRLISFIYNLLFTC